MFRKPPDKDVWQDQAADLVGAVLSAKFESFDDGSENAMVDFVGRTSLDSIALEVTSTVDTNMRSLADDIKPPTGIADHLRYEWRFTMPWSVARPGKKFWPNLLATIEELELKLDVDGLALFGGALGQEEEAESPYRGAATKLKEMGFIQGSATHVVADGHGAIHIGFGGFMPSGDPILSVLEAIDNNVTKLLAMNTTEKHLFVWVHETNLAMMMRLLLDVGPRNAVDLRGIDQVWLAPWQENTSDGILLARTWTLRTGEVWHRVMPPTEH